MIERARAAHAAGLESLFVGDHHITPQPYYQNTPMIARMLAEWGRREAGALYLLPLWNPVLLAEQTATLACIAEGRFILQCGIGAGRSQSAGMGVNYKHRPSMFEESLAILRSLWAGKTVDHSGRWHLEGARIAPTPPAPIDVWIGAAASVAIDRAARLGEAWICGPGTTLQATRRQLDDYLGACARHGRTPTRIVLRRDVYVGTSRTEAISTMRPYLDQGYRGFEPDALVIGDVAEVTDGLAAYAELGFSDVLIRNISRDQDQALGTIERLAEVRQRLA